MNLQKGYNGNTSKRGRLGSIIQKSQGSIFTMQVNFASITKISLASEISLD